MHRSFTRLAIAAVAALTVTACAGGDDEADTTEATTTLAESVEPSTTVTATSAPTTTVATTQSTTTPATDATTAPPSTTAPVDDTGAETDDDVVIIDSLGDLPDECRNALADFLRTVEPVVSDIDWDTATMADFEQINTELEDEGEIFDQTTEECGDFDFASDEESMQAMIEFAEDEAPGTVGWLEFIGAIAFPGEENAAAAMTCEDAIAYFDELIAGGATTMSSLPVSELADVSAVLNVITTDCDVEVMDEFLSREDVTAFLS